MQDDINKTVYTVTLRKGNNFSTVNVIWRPQNLAAQMPQVPSNGLVDYTTGYYDCNSFNWFCMLVLDNQPDDGLTPPLYYWANNTAVIKAQTDFMTEPVWINLLNLVQSTLVRTLQQFAIYVGHSKWGIHEPHLVLQGCIPQHRLD
jgi:hypothetical protein